MSRTPQRPSLLYILQALLGIAIVIILALFASTYFTPEPSSDQAQATMKGGRE